VSTVLITGATDGLGRGVAHELAAGGHTVLVHGRTPERTAPVVAELTQVPGAGDVRAYHADLASFDAVRSLAAAVREQEERLDVLVNNAGIGTTVPGGPERQESADGYELRFAVNYLAGFLLTHELLDLLRASAPARIVNVASAGQQAIDFDDVMLERDYSGVRAYCQSKLAQILFTVDLAAQLGDSGVTVTALHPATYMPTKIVTGAYASTLAEGVEATVRLIADPELATTTGVYFNGLREATPDPQAADPEARRRLRQLSESLTAAG
jgi:NAD(P)-dependent dehydrogenase (short-subunit alcohol dehydrogenase family)